MNCPITLEDFNEGDVVTQIIHCGHIFQPHSIDNWFQRNVHCPVCRYDIRNTTTATDASGGSNTMNSIHMENQETIDDESVPPPLLNTATNSHMDDLLTNISSGLGTIIQNYLENERPLTAPASTDSTALLIRDISRLANGVEFEFPVLLYRDLSGNRRTFM
jgi:hypothetical protein